MNTKIENLRTMEQKNLKKAAVIAAGTAAMMGMNTTVQAREAENTESANEQFDTASVSQQDQIVQDIETAQNDVVQAEKELAPVEQEYTQAQDDFNQAQSEADQATQNLDNAHQAAQEVIDQEEGRLKDEIKKAEESIQTNEETIESLTKENEQKEQEVKEAKDSIVQKEAELEQAKAESDKVSDAQIQNAQATFQDALDQANQAKAELEEAELQILSKNGQIQKVRTDLEKTQSGYNQAVAVHEKAQNEYKTAKEKADTAQKVYDAIINGTSVDKELLEKARQDVTNAQEALTAAYSELEKAKKAVSAKKVDIASLQATIQNLENRVNANQAKEIVALRQKVSEKEKELADKQAALIDLQNKKADSDSKVAAKQNELNNAKTELSQKESDLQSLRDRLATVKDMIANPSKYEVVKDAERQSSLGFFKSLGLYGDRAVEYLTSNRKSSEYNISINDTTYFAQKGDATSLENMKKSLQYIKKCNELRKKEGKTELRISPYLMAVAQAQANMSAVEFDHHQTVMVGENLAWVYSDPFDGWYTQEKNNYLTNNGGQTGHYLNIINDKYYGTGYGINSATYGDVHSQTFLQQPNLPYFKDPNTGHFVSTRDTYSVDEFERLFNAYYEANKVEEIDVDALNKEVNTINSKITEATKAVNSTKNKVNGLTEELSTLKTENASAVKNVTKGVQSIDAVKSEMASLVTKIKELENQLILEQEKEIEALRQKVADKEKEVASKQNALTDLQNKKATLDSKVSAKQNELNTAKSELSQKEGDLQSLRDRLATVKDMIANPDKYEAEFNAERQNALEFFRSLGEKGKKAVEILTNTSQTARVQGEPGTNVYNILSYTHLGQKGDATSLENIKKAIELLKIANQLRIQEGKQEFKVSPAAMAIAQLDTNMSSDKIAHIFSYSTNGQNLAWGTDNPFDGWYTVEKQNYLTNNGKQTGHYENLMDEDFVVTGIAFNQYSDYGSSAGQEFLTKDRYGDAMSVEEFERLFNAYYEANKVEEIDVDALNKEVNTINSKITETAKAVNSLKNKVNVLTNELNTLKTEKTTAESNVTKANQALRTVQSELSAMQGQFDQAIQALHAGDAQTSLNTAYSQLESAKGELTDLERKEEGREFKVNQAQTILANAQKVLKDLEPDLETATKNLASAQAEAEVKKQALNTARQSMDTLENAWKELQKTLEQAIQKREALNMEYANAKAKVDRAENVLKTAGEEVERYRAICQAVTDIQAEIDTLKEQIDATTGKMETNKETIVNVLNENAVLEESIPGFNEALSILNAYRQPLTMAYAGQSYTIDFDEKGAYKELADQIDQIASLYQTKAQKQGALDSAKAVLDALTPDYSAAKEKVAQARKTLAHARQALKDYLASLMQTNEGAQLETSLVSEQRINHPVSHAPELEVNGRMVQRVEQPFEKLAETKGSQHKEKKADKEASDTVKPSQSNPTIPLTAGGLVVAGGVAAFLAKTRKKKEA